MVRVVGAGIGTGAEWEPASMGTGVNSGGLRDVIAWVGSMGPS